MLICDLVNIQKNRKKAKKAQRSIKTIAGRLIRELNRLLPINNPYKEDLALFENVIQQKRNSKNKIYSLHEPEVCCISKGKVNQMYEFGNKVSIVVTQNTGVIVGAKILEMNLMDIHWQSRLSKH